MKGQTGGFKVNDFVVIKKYRGCKINERGRIKSIYDDGRIWVCNLNMPFSGTISKTFEPDELERIEENETE